MKNRRKLNRVAFERGHAVQTFAITRGTTNGFVSAGHCGNAGNTTTGYNQVAQGTNLPVVPREALRGIVERDTLHLLGLS